MSFLQDQSDLIPIAIGVAAIVTLLGGKYSLISIDMKYLTKFFRVE